MTIDPLVFGNVEAKEPPPGNSSVLMFYGFEMQPNGDDAYLAMYRDDRSRDRHFLVSCARSEDGWWRAMLTFTAPYSPMTIKSASITGPFKSTPGEAVINLILTIDALGSLKKRLQERDEWIPSLPRS